MSPSIVSIVSSLFSFNSTSMFDFTHPVVFTSLLFTLCLVVPYFVTGTLFAIADLSGYLAPYDLRRKDHLHRQALKVIRAATVPSSPNTPTHSITATTTTTPSVTIPTSRDASSNININRSSSPSLSPSPSPSSPTAASAPLNFSSSCRTWRTYVATLPQQFRDLVIVLPLCWSMCLYLLHRQSLSPSLMSSSSSSSWSAWLQSESSDVHQSLIMTGLERRWLGGLLAPLSWGVRTWCVQLLQMACAYLLNQLWRWFIHRTFHEVPWLYKRVHSVHHAPLREVHALAVWHNAFPEFMLMEVVSICLPFLIIAPTLHVSLYAVFMIIVGSTACIDHAGIYVNALLDSRLHWRHHTDITCNYTELSAIDKFFGTFKDIDA